MSKVASFISLALIKLDKSSKLTFHRQVYESLRQGILEGRLKAGSRLPSTRALAVELKLSRNTVSRAFEQLIDEGYLESRVGSGTRVTKTLPDAMLNVSSVVSEASVEASEKKEIQLSERGKAIFSTLYPIEDSNPFYWQTAKPKAFSPAVPALDAFPMKLWEKTLIAAWRKLEYKDLSYQGSMAMGYEPLKEALAAYTQAARGVRCTAEQVVITNGTQEALSIIANLLLNPGDKVWVENPSYQGIHVALRAVSAEIVPVPVDEEGLLVDAGVERAADARMAYIAPSHQYPLGVTMSLGRRLSILQWAEDNDMWIIEDDYDSEFRYEGYPLEALQGLDKSGSVIYIGTFSKVLCPALRHGYMVVPPSLIEPIRAARAHIDRGLNLITQVALCHFIEEGHFARHIRRMRALYAERQAFLLGLLENLSEGLEAEPHDAGLHLVGWLKDRDDQELSKALLKEGVVAPALSSFALEPLERKGLLLGYTAPEYEMRQAVEIMTKVLAEV